MCIICYKEEDQPLPTEEQLKNCWSNHDDGAGMAWYLPEEDMWQVKKGFMTWDEFEEAYTAEEFTPKHTLLIHFRTGTSGKGKGHHPKQTHPFPIKGRCRDMEAMTYKARKILFHNGIVGMGSAEYSDTMFGIRDYVYPLLKYIDDINIHVLLGELWEIGRVIITRGWEIIQYGKWKTDDAGLQWSNEDYAEDKIAKWYREEEEKRKKYSLLYNSRTPEILPFKDDYNSPFRKSDGAFDWEKWDKDAQNRADAILEASIVPPNEDEMDRDCSIDDIEGSTVVGMVDGNDTFIGFDQTYHTDTTTYNFLMCPYCSEDKYLQDSPFSTGDTVCLVCGCVFMDDAGKTLFFDPDIKKGYDQSLREEAA